MPATDPDLIASLKQLGELLGSQGRYQEASQFFHRTPPPEAPALGAYRPPGDVAFPGQQLLVFFGTNRAQDINHAGSFGSAMSTEQSLGFAIVDLSYDALTATTRAGGTELLKKSDPRYLMIRTVRTVGADEILSEIRPRIAKSKAFAREAIVFVHGFDVSFDDALRRAAQLEHDLAFDGAVFVYSWPSRGQLSEVDYFADQATSLSTAPNLRAFLQFVVAKSGASVVHLIAHSMGSPVLLAALTDLQSDPNWADLHIGQVILAAPDMDAKQFADAIPRLRNVASGITMYASSSDRALLASQFVNRKQSSRAGFISTAGPTVVDGVDTIDVTEAGTDVFSVNHSAYAESSALIEDIKHLLQGQRPPDRREPTMEKSTAPGGTYWRLTLAPQ